MKNRLERKRSWHQTMFNKKGHEEQFKHTAEILETLDNTLEFLVSNDTKLQQKSER